MPQGYDLEARVVNLNDSAELTAVLYGSDDKPRSPSDLVSVTFAVQLPDLTLDTVVGEIQDDGSGYAVFNNSSLVGHYIAIATFTDVDGLVKSVRTNFDVRDPFDTSPNFSASYLVATMIWAKIEDCFDADVEGPFLRDVTENTFSKEKMESFLDIALFDLNYLNPPTTLGLVDFVHTDPTSHVVSATTDLPVLTQGAFIACLRHLMTSYVEQPNPSGAQVGWLDRRDYLQRWMQVYTIEFAVYDRMAKLFKRKFLGLGTTKGLLSSKAGRLIPAPMRSRMIGRGYWSLFPFLPFVTGLLHHLRF